MPNARASIWSALTEPSGAVVYTVGIRPTNLRDVVVLQVEMQSPFKLRLGLGNITSSAVKALVYLCETIMFYREERSRREAEAANAWEDVYMKRLERAKKARQIASGNKATFIDEEAVSELMEYSAVIEKSALRMTGIRVDKRPPDNG